MVRMLSMASVLGVGMGYGGKRAAVAARRGQQLVARRGQQLVARRGQQLVARRGREWGPEAYGRGIRQGKGWAWVVGETWVSIVVIIVGDGPRHT